MIATDRFVFLHLIKSGGSFVGEFLRRFVPSAHLIGSHLPRRLVPAEHAGLPMLGFVRNPWYYYVSWYHFQAERLLPNSLFTILSDGGRLDFDATVRNLLDLGAGSPRLDAVLASLPAGYGGVGIQLPQYALAPIRDSGLGFYSYVYSYFYGEPDPNLTIERSEELRPRLLEFLERVAVPVRDDMRAFIQDAPRRNISIHRPYIDYYSDELRNLVATRDQLVIRRHQYAFGDSL
jgi:hypothetical protein